MAFEEIKENAEAIHDNAKGYIESTLAYYKLRAFQVMVKSTVFVVKFFLIVICLIVCLFFVSIGGALVIGEYYGNYPLGFFCIGGIYFILFILLLLIKDKLVKTTFLHMFSDIFFKD